MTAGNKQPSIRRFRQGNQLVEIVAPALRALLAKDNQLKVVTFDDSDVVRKAVNTAGASLTASSRFLQSLKKICGCAAPLWFEPPAKLDPQTVISRLSESITKHTRTYKLPPSVILVKGLGMFTAGDDFSTADHSRRRYKDIIRTSQSGKRISLPDAQGDLPEILQQPPTGSAKSATLSGRAAGKIALVTGAAQGLGLEISRDLATQGAYVVLADINAKGAVAVAAQLCKQFGDGRAIGLAVDVTNSKSIARAVHQVVRKYGGLDLFISNAGVLKAGSVKTLPESDFELVTAVNYKGYFLCVQKIAPILTVQHLARPGYWSDIIQVNSKSGLVGSSRNAAYAGSKFGGIGLTQSFALELLEDGIKVNAVCPGNFFDGPLWSDPQNGLFVQYLQAGKVPEAKSVADVRRAYEAKIPLGRGCIPADIMAAIYYIIEQQYETGQAIPVTGGQVMRG